MILWFAHSVVAVLFTASVLVQHTLKQRSSLFTAVVTAGFKATRHSFLFDVLLLLRKCGLVLVAFLLNDAFMSMLASLAMSAVVWMVVLRWKPFVPPRQDMLARICEAVVFVLQVRCCVLSDLFSCRHSFD